MSTRKEEERNEKIIRGLMKLPPNRKCINCNSLVFFSFQLLFTVSLVSGEDHSKGFWFIGFLHEQLLRYCLVYILLVYGWFFDFIDSLSFAGSAICLYEFLDVYLYNMQWNSVSESFIFIFIFIYYYYYFILFLVFDSIILFIMASMMSSIMIFLTVEANKQYFYCNFEAWRSWIHEI